MLIASQKRKENIAEYLLYMFQIEDIIRANDFDIGKIEKNIINKFPQPYSVQRDIRNWYSSLILLMDKNNLRETGHLPVIQLLIDKIETYHKHLLNDSGEFSYHQIYLNAKPSIEDLKSKSDKTKGDIELCLNGLYGLLLLRLAKKNISPETNQAFQFISKFLAVLSSKYLSFEN